MTVCGQLEVVGHKMWKMGGNNTIYNAKGAGEKKHLTVDSFFGVAWKGVGPNDAYRTEGPKGP